VHHAEIVLVALLQANLGYTMRPNCVQENHFLLSVLQATRYHFALVKSWI